MTDYYTGKRADPQWRHERAVKAAAARDSIDRLIQRIVARAPELTAEHRGQLAAMLNGTTPPKQSRPKLTGAQIAALRALLPDGGTSDGNP